MASREQFVIEKYDLKRVSVVEDFKLGEGPLLDPQAFEKFKAADPSGNLKYLDWMLFMAGGGQQALETQLLMWLSFKDDCSTPEMERFYMVGDQDVARLGGFGFFRHWPGPNSLYERVCSLIKLWHRALPSLKGKVEVDLYFGWKKGLSQRGAAYSNYKDCLKVLGDVRRQLVLEDVRFDLIYEDDNLVVRCPLTIGASIKFGICKWCTANIGDVNQGLADDNPMMPNWVTYNKQGPLVYFHWKTPMTCGLDHMALHCKDANRSIALESYVDMNNEPGGVSLDTIRGRISASELRQSLELARAAIATWLRSFDRKRIKLKFWEDLSL
jgi:hypothetical protein